MRLHNFRLFRVIIVSIGLFAIAGLSVNGLWAADEKTIVIATAQTLAGLDFETQSDPTSLEVQQSVYDRLVAFKRVKGPDGLWTSDFTKFEPRLAESWGVSADGLTWTIKLRKGLKSNWGNELTAQDVKWNWDRKWGLKIRGPFLYAFAGLKDNNSVKVVDDYTIQFLLENPNPTFMLSMEVIANQIFDSTEVKKHITNDDPWGLKFTENKLAGWGPYVIEKWTPGSELVLKARKDYPVVPAKVDKIIYREVPSSANRVALLQQGTVDIAENLSPREQRSLDGKPGVVVDHWQGMYMVAIVLNHKIKPFDNPKVRRALLYATPYNAIMKGVYLGTVKQLKGFSPSVLDFAYEEGWPYKTDYEKAKKLIAESGVPGKIEIEFTYGAGFPEHEQIAIQMKSGFKKVGIDLKLRNLPAASYTEQRQAKKLMMFVMEDNSYLPDTGLNYQLFYWSKSFVNESGWANSRADNLILEGLQTMDKTKRKTIYSEVAKIMMNDPPTIPLVQAGYHLSRRKNISGATFQATSRLEYRHLDKSD